MKILHVTQGYAPARGGTEMLMQRVSEELVRQFGDDVTVFTTNCLNCEGFYSPRSPRLPVGCEQINGVRVRRFDVRRRRSQALQLPQAVAYRLHLPFNEYLRTLASGPIAPTMDAALRADDWDVIAASSFPYLHMYRALRVARRNRRPCVLIGALHPEDCWGFERGIIYDAIRRASHYIAYTDYEADQLVAHGIAREHISVIGVGVDADEFACVDAHEARRHLDIQDQQVVGYIGQLGDYKGVDTLARAMPRVWQTFPNARLLIAGGRTRFTAQLERIVAAWSRADQQKVIRRYDFAADEKPPLFAALDVFVYPSAFESFGIGYLEAWASGKPVIGARRGAVPNVINEGRDGLLVEYQNEHMLSDAIVELLANPQRARAMGEAGRAKVRARYTWREIARRFRAVYAEAVSTR